MDKTKSYFLTSYGGFRFINSCDTTKPHLDYVPPSYMNGSLMAKTRRLRYCEEIDEWLNTPLIDSEYWIRIEREQQEYNEDEELMIKNVCFTMFNELVEAVIESGFEISDIKQFKEDFIHYMYTLSENTEPYYE